MPAVIGSDDGGDGHTVVSFRYCAELKQCTAVGSGELHTGTGAGEGRGISQACRAKGCGVGCPREAAGPVM